MLLKKRPGLTLCLKALSSTHQNTRILSIFNLFALSNPPRFRIAFIFIHFQVSQINSSPYWKKMIHWLAQDRTFQDPTFENSKSKSKLKKETLLADYLSFFLHNSESSHNFTLSILQNYQTTNGQKNYSVQYYFSSLLGSTFDSSQLLLYYFQNG